jgi:recombinational DNA repair protein RecR
MEIELLEVLVEVSVRGGLIFKFGGVECSGEGELFTTEIDKTCCKEEREEERELVLEEDDNCVELDVLAEFKEEFFWLFNDIKEREGEVGITDCDEEYIILRN